MDKAGTTVEYLIAKYIGINDVVEDIPIDELLNTEYIGEEICYGPAYGVTSKNAASLWEKIKDMNCDEVIRKHFLEAESFPGE